MKTSIYLLFFIFLCSCVNPSDHQKALTTIDSLSQKIKLLEVKSEQLEKDLNSYKMDPNKLVADAQKAFSAEDEKELIRISKLLSEYHPESDKKEIVDRLYSKIVEIKKQRVIEEENKRLAAVNKLNKKHDDVSGCTFYKNPYFKHYIDTNGFSIYINNFDTEVYLRIRMSYAGDDWIFFDKAYLSYDGNTHEVVFNKYEDQKSDNDGGIVYEWFDILASDEDISFLRKFVNGKEIKMRLKGKYSKTRNLSKNEINGIKDVLLGYDVLKKEFQKK